MNRRVLIVDDEPEIGCVLERLLQLEGISAHHLEDPEAGLQLLKEEPFEIVLSDLRMPTIDGIELLRRAKQIRPECEVVLMTAFATVETAREALKRGAADYITKPFSIEKELLPILHELLDAERGTAADPGDTVAKTDSRAATEDLSTDPSDFEDRRREALSKIIGSSALMRRTLGAAQKLARSDSSVLLRGESGSGKEIFAELIHRLSGRSLKPFIKVNCAALPESLLESELFGYVRGAFTGADRNREGLFQVADGGTLLLDEIGEISPTFQPKLLRVLQDGTFHRIGESRNPRTVDVRVIAATNRDLEEAIEKGAFRRDLFYRLSVIPLHIPPLRDHIEDLPELIEYFVTKLGNDRKIQFNKASMESLVNYWWPGNVRELASAIEYAMVLGESDVIEPEDLPVAIQDHQRLAGRTIQSGLAGEESLEAIEKRCILQAMVRTNANQKSAADILGITRRKLGYRIAKYALEGEIAAIQFQVGTGPATPRRQVAKVRGTPTPSSRVGASPKSEH